MPDGVTTPTARRSRTASRCPSRRRTSSRSRCACRRCPSARPPRSCSRPGRRAATWCATSSATCSGWPITDERGRPLRARAPRQAALARSRPAGARSASATACSRSRPACARRSSTTATATGTAPACSSTSTGELARPCRVDGRAAAALGLAGRDRAGAGGGRARRLRRPPTSTSWSTRRSRSARTRRARSASGGTRFELALYGRCNADAARLVDILRRIVAATGRMFGGFPFDRYLFIVHALPIGYGRPRAPRVGDDGHRRACRSRTRPATGASPIWRRTSSSTPGTSSACTTPRWGRFDYTRENYTRLLWLFEGFTDYLAHIIMLRAGRHGASATSYRMIAEDWPKYATRPGRNETPLDELSFEAWIKQYKPSENFINRAVSYYEKGLVGGDGAGPRAAAGDRRAARPARDVPPAVGPLRRAPARDRPRRTCATRPRRSPGGGWIGFFDRYVHGTDELPLPALWRRAGPDGDGARRVGRERQAAGRSRRRARAARAGLDRHRPASRAHCWSATSSPTRPPGAPGITFGDDIVAVGGARVNRGDLRQARRRRRRRARASAIAFFRRDLLREATLTLAESPARTLDRRPPTRRRTAPRPRAVRDRLARPAGR